MSQRWTSDPVTGDLGRWREGQRWAEYAQDRQEIWSQTLPPHALVNAAQVAAPAPPVSLKTHVLLAIVTLGLWVVVLPTVVLWQRGHHRGAAATGVVTGVLLLSLAQEPASSLPVGRTAPAGAVTPPATSTTGFSAQPKVSRTAYLRAMPGGMRTWHPTPPPRAHAGTRPAVIAPRLTSATWLQLRTPRPGRSETSCSATLLRVGQANEVVAECSQRNALTRSAAGQTTRCATTDAGAHRRWRTA